MEMPMVFYNSTQSNSSLTRLSTYTVYLFITRTSRLKHLRLPCC